MNKLLIPLFFSLLFIISCGKEPSNKIDQKATNAASWKVGQVMYNVQGQFVGDKLYRKFIGVTDEGLYYVQDYFADYPEIKATEPFLVHPFGDSSGLVIDYKKEGPYIAWAKDPTKENTWYKIAEDFYVDNNPHGLLTMYHTNGQKMVTVNFVHGKKNGIEKSWHENGHLFREETYENDVSTRIVYFDEQGNITNTLNFLN